MDFLEKLDYMMARYGLNKRTLSAKSDIPYTTIVNWYKRGYDGLKLATLRKLSDYFNTFLDFWVLDEVTDPNYGKANSFSLEFEETQHIVKYRSLDSHGKEAVDSILEVEFRRVEQARERAPMEAAAEMPFAPAFASDQEPDTPPGDLESEADQFAAMAREQYLSEKLRESEAFSAKESDAG